MGLIKNIKRTRNLKKRIRKMNFFDEKASKKWIIFWKKKILR